MWSGVNSESPTRALIVSEWTMAAYAQRTARDLHRVDLISFEVVIDRAAIYINDLRSLGHAPESEVFTATRTPNLFTEYAGRLRLRRVHDGRKDHFKQPLNVNYQSQIAALFISRREMASEGIQINFIISDILHWNTSNASVSENRHQVGHPAPVFIFTDAVM
jgi:hypothetical protein